MLQGGETEGHPNKKKGASEWKRGGHPGLTDKAGERVGEAGLGERRNEGGKRENKILAWCPSKHFAPYKV